jgi:hypothetical protein
MALHPSLAALCETPPGTKVDIDVASDVRTIIAYSERDSWRVKPAIRPSRESVRMATIDHLLSQDDTTKKIEGIYMLLQHSHASRQVDRSEQRKARKEARRRKKKEAHKRQADKAKSYPPPFMVGAPSR